MDVVRSGQRIQVPLATSRLSDNASDRIVLFAGTVLQETPAAVLHQRGTDRDGVYISVIYRGSPSTRHKVSPTLRITAVDGKVCTCISMHLR